MKHRLAALSIALIATLPTPAGAADGMGEGNGPCMGIATPTERRLMRHESRGWPTARNRRSTAYGCGQLLHANRQRFARTCHTVAHTIDPAAQMCMLRSYIHTRFGTAERALAFRLSHGWY